MQDTNLMTINPEANLEGCVTQRAVLHEGFRPSHLHGTLEMPPEDETLLLLKPFKPLCYGTETKAQYVFRQTTRLDLIWLSSSFSF